jgi:hypothetical protein
VIFLVIPLGEKKERKKERNTELENKKESLEPEQE